MRRTSIVLFSILVVFGSLAVARFDLLNAAAQGMQGMPMPTAAEKQKLSDLHKRLAAFKADLTKAGKYSCCLKESCDFLRPRCGDVSLRDEGSKRGRLRRMQNGLAGWTGESSERSRIQCESASR